MEASGLLGVNKVIHSSLQLKPDGFGARDRVSPSRTAVQLSNSSRKLRVVSEYDEQKQSTKDKWRGLAFDASDDQQDITRGKGMVDTLFQAPAGSGTHYAVMSSYDYTSAGLRQ
ncbi:hypothetical protein CRG98_007408 [Punica granatum]|uniref:Uncharacterized protein n=1 Tax=Punica granatum TaxID=22663 RepID=A0A2I0KV59_PUNGR|nr:hypothetical protein CRG98_007408 [Punica granatum]